MIIVLGILAILSLAFMALFLKFPKKGIFLILLSIPFGGIELSMAGKTPKIYFATWLSFLLLASLFCRYLYQGKLTNRSTLDEFASLRKKLTLAVVVYVIMIIFSVTIYNDFFRSSYIGTTRILTLLSFLAALKFSQQPGDRIRVLQIVAIVGGAIAILYIFGNIQVYDTSSLESFARDISRKDNLARAGLLGVSNTIASFMAYTIPLTTAFLTLHFNSLNQRIISLCSLGFQIIALVLTNSRGGVASLAGAILVMMLIRLTAGSRMRAPFKFASSLLLLVIISYAVNLLTPVPIKERYQSVISNEYLNQYSVPKRLELLDSSWKAFVSHPLFGLGIGNVGSYDFYFGTGAGSETHNLFLQTLAEEGIFSFLILIYILGTMGLRLIHLSRRGSLTPQYWIFTAFLSCLLNANIESTFFAPQFAPLFWLSVAILLSGPASYFVIKQRIHPDVKEVGPKEALSSS